MGLSAAEIKAGFFFQKDNGKSQVKPNRTGEIPVGCAEREHQIPHGIMPQQPAIDLLNNFARLERTNKKYCSVAPGVIWLTAPGHNSDNSDIIVGTLRTTFEF